MFVDALPAGTRANLAVLAKAGLADPFFTLQGLERLAGMAEDLR